MKRSLYLNVHSCCFKYSYFAYNRYLELASATEKEIMKTAERSDLRYTVFCNVVVCMTMIFTRSKDGLDLTFG